MNRTLNILKIVIFLISTSNVHAAVLYGTTAISEYCGPGFIYSINYEEKTAEMLLDISLAEIVPLTAPEIIIANDSPNGSAYEPNNRRLYFASFKDPGAPANPSVPFSELYYYDFNDPNHIFWAGSLEGHASDGDFYNGVYYYISHGTNTLRSVSLNSDGTINQDNEVAVIWMTDPSSGQLYAPLWSFGDITFDKEGLLYITGAIRTEAGVKIGPLTGTYNIETGQFDTIDEIYIGQIAFSPDGSLFYHNTGTGEIAKFLSPQEDTSSLNLNIKLTDLAAYSSDKDFNFDSKINFVDFALFSLRWSEQKSTETEISKQADLNMDGKVDLNDILILMDHWLETAIKKNDDIDYENNG